VSFVLIGVAESMDELRQVHPSLARTMVAIALPLLPDSEVSALLEKGCQDLRITLAAPARAALLMLARGSPYFAQLLSLHASDSAVKRGTKVLESEDVAAATALILEESRHSFEPMLAGLPRADQRWPDLMFAAARSPCNGFGWFTAATARETATTLGMDLPSDLTFGLSVLASPDGGDILKKRRMPEHDEYAFSQVNLRNYVLLREVERRHLLGTDMIVDLPPDQGADMPKEAVEEIPPPLEPTAAAPNAAPPDGMSLLEAADHDFLPDIPESKTVA
jgi:hypothetical protein